MPLNELLSRYLKQRYTPSPSPSSCCSPRVKPTAEPPTTPPSGSLGLRGDQSLLLDGMADRFEDLTEDVLLQVLSFLPSQEAVQTCVLAKRWRPLWKSVPSLRMFATEDDDEEIISFVNKFIELRDPTVRLDVCEMIPVDDIESWLQYAASCQVKVLQIRAPDEWDPYQLSNNSVISKHLTKLELYNVEIDVDHSLDLSPCEALEVLDMERSLINIAVIDSKSLRRLRVKDSSLNPDYIRTRISAPGLVTCELSDCHEFTPLFGSLPSLTTAFISITSQSEEPCSPSSPGYCEGFCCQDDCSVLLEGLSGATNLELICDWNAMTFSKELRWKPMFDKLKTVLLNDWCVADNFTGLIYFLQHSPILESLTVQLNPLPEFSSNMLESKISKEQLSVSKYLKVVDIKCCKVDKSQFPEIVKLLREIVKLLGTLGVTQETIKIHEDFHFPHLFSFETKEYETTPVPQSYIFTP